MCGDLGVRSYPSVRAYYSAQDIDGEVYEGEHSPEAIESWVRGLLQPSGIVRLGQRNFAEEVQRPGSGLWLVDFSAGSWCGPCTSLKREV